MILQLRADVKYHVPTGFGFSPEASGIYSLNPNERLGVTPEKNQRVPCVTQETRWREN